MAEKEIPDIVVSRLPLYLQGLIRLKESGKHTTSSQELAEMLGMSAAQIRKDLSHFGEFGKQGTGYRIDHLTHELTQILHLDRVWKIVLVGAGDVGHAIARYQGFANRGFCVEMIFDADPEKIGKKVGSYIIEDIAQMEERVRASQIQIAMLTVPAHSAQSVADQLVIAGVRAILNYAPIPLNLPSHVLVHQFDPIVHIQHMTYYLA